MSVNEVLFGKRETQKDRSKYHDRQIRRVEREMARQQIRHKREEATHMRELQAMAKDPKRHAELTVKAQEVAMARDNIKNGRQMQLKITGMKNKMERTKNTHSMIQGVQCVTASMNHVNASISGPQLQQTIMRHEQETAKLDMKQDLLADCLDDLFENDDIEEESNDIVSDILTEVGINQCAELTDISTTHIPDPRPPNAPMRSTHVAAPTRPISTQPLSQPPVPTNGGKTQHTTNAREPEGQWTQEDEDMQLEIRLLNLYNRSK